MAINLMINFFFSIVSINRLISILHYKPHFNERWIHTISCHLVTVIEKGQYEMAFLVVSDASDNFVFQS